MWWMRKTHTSNLAVISYRDFQQQELLHSGNLSMENGPGLSRCISFQKWRYSSNRYVSLPGLVPRGFSMFFFNKNEVVAPCFRWPSSETAG